MYTERKTKGMCNIVNKATFELEDYGCFEFSFFHLSEFMWFIIGVCNFYDQKKMKQLL